MTSFPDKLLHPGAVQGIMQRQSSPLETYPEWFAGPLQPLCTAARVLKEKVALNNEVAAA
jgi:hypothetical protein